MAGKLVEPTKWAEEFRRTCDTDPELNAHGKFFNCSYLLDMGERKVVVHMSEGKVKHAILDPGPLDEHYQFAIRAEPETWRHFAEPVPPPMYHGIWAATFRSGMKLEGDLLVLMQNLRCVTRQIELLRVAGVPLSERR